MDVNAYTNQLLVSQPDLSEQQLQESVDAYIGRCWLSETKEGREFDEYYKTPANIEKLSEIFDLLDELVTFQNLSAAFNKLKASAAIKTHEQIQQAAEEAQQQQGAVNRARWKSDCAAWLDSHSTREIAERSERDPAFRAYLKSANRIPQLAVEFSPENLSRQRKAEKIQRERDRQYADVPSELWTFAEAYKRLPAAEALKRMSEPPFKSAVEACAKAGLI